MGIGSRAADLPSAGTGGGSWRRFAPRSAGTEAGLWRRFAPRSAGTETGRFNGGGGAGRLMLGMAVLALVALVAAALVGGRPGGWLELAGLGLLLAAPWTLVVGRLAAALRRRAWRRAALAAVLLLLASLAWLRPGWFF